MNRKFLYVSILSVVISSQIAVAGSVNPFVISMKQEGVSAINRISLLQTFEGRDVVKEVYPKLEAAINQTPVLASHAVFASINAPQTIQSTLDLRQRLAQIMITLPDSNSQRKIIVRDDGQQFIQNLIADQSFQEFVKTQGVNPAGITIQSFSQALMLEQLFLAAGYSHAIAIRAFLDTVSG